MICVLVVDDESDIREAVSELLVDEGYSVLGAASGAEALKQLKDHRPALVLLDLMMPGMNGWQFRAAQKDDPDLSKIPVIVLSAFGRTPGLDADGYLQKPFEVQQLLDAIRAQIPSA